MIAPRPRPRRQWPHSRSILLLVADRGIRPLLVGLLTDGGKAGGGKGEGGGAGGTSPRDVTVVTHTEEVRTLVAAHRYGLVIVTNFGESPWNAIDTIPDERDWPALFISGHWDDDLFGACRRKRVPRLATPFDPSGLIQAVAAALAAPGPDWELPVAVEASPPRPPRAPVPPADLRTGSAEGSAERILTIDKRVYLAAGDGTPEHQARARSVARTLRLHGHRVTLSRADTPPHPFEGGLFAAAGATASIEAAHCVLVLLPGRGLSQAAAWELGVAASRNLPILGLRIGNDAPGTEPGEGLPGPLRHLLRHAYTSLETLCVDLMLDLE